MSMLLEIWEFISVNFKKLALVATAFLIYSNDLNAYIKSGRCEPYYASIKSNRVNSHRGPGKEYKISYEYIQKGTPVMVIAKYDHWRKVKDPLGDESWIHKSMLSPKRFVMVTSENPTKLMEKSNETSELVAYVRKNVVLELISVRGNWCNVVFRGSTENYSGWINKSAVFGVFENETT